MMGLAKIGPDGWSYYAQEIVSGAEDYFLGRGEEIGRWMGSGCQSIGVSGPVEEESLGRLFGAGRHPVSGVVLGRPWDLSRRESVAGFALSFSPQKSVSLLWALAEPMLYGEVREAHDAAVSAAISFLEDHAAFTRRGRGGLIQEDTDGLLAAAFVHRTSRAGDPQLHTHLLVANKVRARSDGAWLALDGRELYEVQKAAGLVYKAGLRAELTRRLGVSWSKIDRDGGAEIVGVPAELIELFSKRRGQVEGVATPLRAEKEVALGRSLTGPERAAVYQLAAYQSRSSKPETGESTPALRSRWHREAVEVCGDPNTWIDQVLNPSRAVAQTEGRTAGRVAGPMADPVRMLISELEQAHSTWGRSDLVEALAVRITPSMAASAERVRQQIELVADQIVSHEDVVSLDSLSPLEMPKDRVRRDGLAVSRRHGARRYSTWQTLALEQHILDVIEAGRDIAVAVVPPDRLAETISAADLSGDQQNVIERLCSNGDIVSVVIGPAGSGKSHTLSAARAAWQAAGVSVRGVAPSAVAAGVLAERAGINSETLAKFLHGARRGTIRLQKGEVIICDEASMVATRDLAALADWVRKAEAKLVLVGDPQQLGAVEAGGLFRLLATDAKTMELTGIHRFTELWEAEATRRLRHQDPTVVDTYQARGRVTSGDSETVLDSAHRAWIDARSQGRSMVVMAADHHTVDQLANRARAALVTAGQVEPDGINLGEQTVGIGDEIVTLRNDRRLVTTSGAWVRNGDRWIIHARDRDNNLRLRSLDGRGQVTIPGSYVADNVALSYAVTVHKAQGVTVDQALLVVDGNTSSEHLYVGMTRGREHNLAAVITQAAGDEHDSGQEPTAREVFETALRRVSGESSATQTLREHLDQADSRRQSLMRQQHHAAGRAAPVPTHQPPPTRRPVIER